MPDDLPRPDFSHEAAGPMPVCGIDEVGRGPLAGPVVAAAVILDPAAIPDGLDDSKRLTAAAPRGAARRAPAPPPSSASARRASPRSTR